MHRPLLSAIRCAVVASSIVLGIGGYQAQAAHQAARTTRTASALQSTDVLVWQGKILPIVTDVYASLRDLDLVIQNADVTGISTVAAQFVGERIRFMQIVPVPTPDRTTARLFAKGLGDMAGATSALAVGIRSGSRSASLQAIKQIDTGQSEFDKAIAQIRHSSGPSGEPTPVAPANAGPTATPIIKGQS
jgi:hypothetical protein